MSKCIKESSVVFSTRGQVVIPRHIRKEFGIEEGTRAIVGYTEDGTIVLRPVTAMAIRKGYGIIKRVPGEKPMSEWRTEHKQEEKQLEEAKIERYLRS